MSLERDPGRNKCNYSKCKAQKMSTTAILGVQLNSGGIPDLLLGLEKERKENQRKAEITSLLPHLCAKLFHFTKYPTSLNSLLICIEFSVSKYALFVFLFLC